MADLFGDPQTMALLGLAQGLLQAGSPSRFPVSTGGALAQGMGGALSGAVGAQGYNMRQQQAQQLEYANRRAKFQADLLDRYSGGNMPNAGGQVAPSPEGATPPGMSPTTSQLMFGTPDYATAPQAAPQALPQGQAPAGGGYFNPRDLFQQGLMFNLAGLPGGSAMMESAINHDPSITGPVALAAKGYVPQPGGGVGLAPGFAAGQGEIAGAQAQAQLPAKSVESLLRYAARPTAYNPFKEQIRTGLDFLPSGLQNVVMSAIPGAGKPAPVSAAPVPQSGQHPQPQLQPQPSASPSFGPTSGSGQLLSPLEEASQAAHGKELEAESSKLRDTANNAVNMNYALDQMSTALTGFKPGPGTNLQMFLEKNLSTLGKPFGVEPPANLGNYQEFTKYANQIAFAATRMLGSREAAQIVHMQIESNPNAELNPEAVKGLMTSMHSMNDYIISKSQAEQAWRGTHRGTTDGFNSYWISHYDPRAWQYLRMTPAEQGKFANTLPPSEASKLKQSIINAREDGWLK